MFGSETETGESKRSMDLSTDRYAIEITDTLIENGFRSVKNGKEVIYFQDNDGIYSPYDVGDIKRWLLEYVDEPQDRNKLLKMALGTLDTIAAGLPTHDSRNPLKVIRDTKDEIFIPFQNGLVVISKDDCDLVDLGREYNPTRHRPKYDANETVSEAK